MPLFDMPKRNNTDKKVLGKLKQKKSEKITVKGGVYTRFNELQVLVDRQFGNKKDDFIIIQNEEELSNYIDACIENGYIAIDTETTGLDPLQDTIAGICIFTLGEKGAYIPINHISYITMERLSNQIPKDIILEQFNRLLLEKPSIDMFNANFDIRVLRAFGLKDIYCTWDGYLASRVLNENEPKKGLKALHNKYVLDGEKEAFSYEDFFKNIPFTQVPLNIAYLYAANDPVITYELCQYQRRFLNEVGDYKSLYYVFHNIEMACLNAVTNMEDNGIAFDMEYQQKLSNKYNELLIQKEKAFHTICDKEYRNKIDKYVLTHTSAKLDNPINISSSKQISILLYDILGIESVDSRNPKGTGEEILSKINLPITNAILEYREVKKLISTYIDKLPACVNPNDGKIHCSFNQYGADTGRFSSSNPNLQNIPSHNKDIRKMFRASQGYLLMSSDYSQQEPKCLAALCRQQGDSQLYDTFMKGKDLYSEIASKAFNVSYEDCLEFNTDGSTNKQGKERRTQAKSILLGVLYGRGVASIAEQLKCSVEKAQRIKDSVFAGFPAIRQFEEQSINMAKQYGYVTTVCGRKRRLPDMMLDEYEFEWIGGTPPDDNLLDFDSDVQIDVQIPKKTIDKYKRKLKCCHWNRDKQNIIKQANEEGIQVKDNTLKIIDATRQVVNSRIQGSAADLTKLALVKLNSNNELKQLGFRLLIPVHDEVIAECPKENIEECSKLLAQVMSQAAEEILNMPIKCDVSITECWYGEEITL